MFLSIFQAATILGVCAKTLRRWDARGILNRTVARLEGMDAMLYELQRPFSKLTLSNFIMCVRS
ncbi:MAG: MerR family transcriptional regulator [Candidatus Helarchaeota archaeon]